MPGEGLDQSGLSDARLAAHDDGVRPAVRGSFVRRLEPTKLGGAPHEPWRRDLDHGPRMIRVPCRPSGELSLAPVSLQSGAVRGGVQNAMSAVARRARSLDRARHSSVLAADSVRLKERATSGPR